MADDAMIPPASAGGAAPSTTPPPPEGITPTSAGESNPMLTPAGASDVSQILGGSGDMLAARGVHDIAPYSPPPTLPNPEQERSHHESFLHRVLDRVGSILGGNETMHVHKDTDGNITVSRDPSTMGEKWGRVAAAALGGFAQAAPQSFGPGGMARGAAAGTEYGLNLPQQMQQNMDAQATAEQKRMLMNASVAKVHQDAYIAMLDAREKQYQIGVEQGKMMNAYYDELQSSPNARDLGTVTDFDSMKRAVESNGGLAGLYGKGLTTRVVPTVDGKGNVQLKLLAVDPGYAGRRNEEPRQIATRVNVDPKTGEPQLEYRTAARNSDTNANLDAAHEAKVTEYLKLHNQWQDTQTKESAEEDRAAERQQAAQDRQERLQWQRQYQQDQIETRREAIGLQREIAQGKGYISGEPVPPAPAGTYDPNFPPTQNFPAGTEGIVRKNIGKPPVDVTKAARLGRSAIQNAQDAIQILQQNPDLVGRLNGYGSRWQQTIGVSNNDPLTRLQAAVEQSTQASLGAHSYRATKYAQEKEEETTNKLKNDPASIISYLNERIRSNQQFVDEERRYNLYGTGYGPDVSHDVSKGQTPQQQNQNPQGQGNVSQAARQQEPQLPTGAIPYRDKVSGQLVGYYPDATKKAGTYVDLTKGGH